MAFVYPPITSPQAERSEQLTRLVYELLDAHTDTERLVLEGRNELHWRAHLSYLRDLHRLGRAVLAEEIGAGDALSRTAEDGRCDEMGRPDSTIEADRR
jgi:hypothetical protein